MIRKLHTRKLFVLVIISKTCVTTSVASNYEAISECEVLIKLAIA